MFYHVYSADSARMQLRAVTGSLREAKTAANALRSRRALSPGVISQDEVPGIVTGIPVWVRYTPGSPAVMITEHESEAAAHEAGAAVFSGILTVISKAGGGSWLTDASMS